MSYDINRYLALQYRRIQQYHSEFLNNKVDLANAVFYWCNNGLAKEYNDTYLENINEIDKLCKTNCNSICRGLNQCTIDDRVLTKIFGGFEWET